MEKFIIRLSAIISNMYIPIAFLNAINELDVSYCDYLFGSSLLLGLVLVVLTHNQGKYHCIWIRRLCYNNIYVPIIEFISAKLCVFNSVMIYVYAIASLWLIFCVINIIIKHLYLSKSN